MGSGRPHLGTKSALGRAARDLAHDRGRLRWLRRANPRETTAAPCVRDQRTDRDAVVAETSGLPS